jgi:hypothetical protein
MRERVFRERRAESEAEDGVFALLGLPRGDKSLTAQITLRRYRAPLCTTPCTAALKRFGRSMDPAEMCFAPSGRTCTTARDPCRGWSSVRSAPTAWASSPTHRAQYTGTPPIPCQHFDHLLELWLRLNRRAGALFSGACRPASVWLVTLLLSQVHDLTRGEVQAGLYYCLGLTMLPLNAPVVQCSCTETLCQTDLDHGMRCPALAAQFTLRHGTLKGILCRAVHRAGIASAR